MTKQEETLQVYRALAEWYEKHGQPQMRDRFLVLASEAALLAGQAQLAEKLRLRLLQQSAQHFLRPYASMAQAMQSADVQTYIRGLKQNYPLSAALDLLRTLHEEDSAAQEAPPAAAPEPEEQPFRNGTEPKTFELEKVNAPPAPALNWRPAPAKAINEPSHRAPVPAPRPLVSPKPFKSKPTKREGAVESSGETGSWFSLFLAIVVAAVGIALAGYTFARPFLPF